MLNDMRLCSVAGYNIGLVENEVSGQLAAFIAAIRNHGRNHNGESGQRISGRIENSCIKDNKSTSNTI